MRAGSGSREPGLDDDHFHPSSHDLRIGVELKKCRGVAHFEGVDTVARAVLREPHLPTAFLDPVSWELRLLVERREDLVAQRVAVTNRLIGRLHQLAPERPKPGHLEREKTRLQVSEFLAGQHGLLAELARQELADIGYFTRAVDSLTENIVGRVRELESTLLQLPGCAD